ncbi:hypothetical protein DIPPA_24778 [Diplonema papillatum]|nr:hypothetical protein DIPPA_24778 [Diplonema papillatum]
MPHCAMSRRKLRSEQYYGELTCRKPNQDCGEYEARPRRPRTLTWKMTVQIESRKVLSGIVEPPVLCDVGTTCNRDLWERFSYIKAVGVDTHRWVLAQQRKTDSFLLCEKSQVLLTKALAPQNLGRSLVMCENFRAGSCTRGADCAFGHIEERKAASGEGDIVVSEVRSKTPLLVLDRREKLLFELDSDAADDTLGLRVACLLVTHPRLARLSSSRLYLCEDFSFRTCPRRQKCPFIHIRSFENLRPRVFSEYPPRVSGQCSLLDAMAKLTHVSARLVEFTKRLDKEDAIDTVAQLNQLSTELFHHMAEMRPDESDLWSLLEQIRLLPDELTLSGAFKKFGVTPQPEWLAVLRHEGLHSIRDLRTVKFKTFLALALPAKVKNVLQTLRERRKPHMGDDPFEVIELNYEENCVLCEPQKDVDPTNDYLLSVVKQLVAFQNRTHEGWRKSNNRQIVTSAITYAVDCTCIKSSSPSTCSELPVLGEVVKPAAVVMENESALLSPGKKRKRSDDTPTPATAGAKLRPHFISYSGLSPNCKPEPPPPAGPKRALDLGESVVTHLSHTDNNTQVMRGRKAFGWCTCPRHIVYSVNYALSTPSGSRCSEQNGLGFLAGSGNPPSSIREVFVRGFMPPEAGNDPNPLFPCGVCEMNFRKLSKDVMRQHRAEIMLYMFDSQSPAPKKLIRIPFSEISNRGSQRFKSFVETEIRTDAEPG